MFMNGEIFLFGLTSHIYFHTATEESQRCDHPPPFLVINERVMPNLIKNISSKFGAVEVEE